MNPSPSTPSGFDEPGARSWAFWALLGVLFGALVFPVWHGLMPPLTDFASHVQLVHGHVGAVDPESVWHGLVERAPWWHPNGVWVHLSSLLYPLVEPITAMRLGFTATLLVSVLGHVRLLEVFGRSRWLVFLAMPLLMWNGMAALGFVNYVPALALVPWVMVAAREAASEPTRGAVAALVGLPLLAVWFHGLGGLLVIGCAGFVLVTSAPSWRRLGLVTTLMPAVLYWAVWFFTAGSGQGGDQSWDGFVTWLTVIRLESLGFFEGAEDDVVFLALFGLLLVTSVAGLFGPRSPRRDLRGWLRENTLLLLACCLLVAYRVLPRYSGDVALAERVIPVFIAVLWALPRPAVAKGGVLIVRGAIAVAVVLSLGFAGVLGQATARFDAEELASALPLIDRIPPNTRAQCVNVRFVQPHFYRRPLDHGCNGLLAVRRGVFAGGGFAETPHNAIRFKPEVAEHRIFDEVWQHVEELALVDWLLVRGPHVPPRSERAVVEGTVMGPQGPRWTLYRSRIAKQPEISSEHGAGGDGGQTFMRQCPVGYELAGLAVAVDPEMAAIEAVGARCVRDIDAPVQAESTAHELIFRTDGVRAPSRELACPSGQRMAGVSVYADEFVRALRLICVDTPTGKLKIRPREVRFGRLKPPESDLSEWQGPTIGDVHELRCPEGEVFSGLRGRRGVIVDQLTIRCSPAPK